ncbi:unannotated protein [freshwater metagenome]|uniref:Unannotated protein n=1 Tax=freshwater metagenome TaxID=449393 RepID=A0A6J6NE82_9ZZZZ
MTDSAGGSRSLIGDELISDASIFSHNGVMARGEHPVLQGKGANIERRK